MEKTFNSATWFNWQQPASPFLLGPTIDACGAPFREMFGFPFFTSVVFYRAVDSERGYQASWLLRLDEGKACGRLLHDMLAVPSSRPWFDRFLEKAFDEVLASALVIAATKLTELTDADLGELFASFYARFVDFYKVGAITEPVQWWAEEVFRKYLETEQSAGRSTASGDWSRDRIERAAFSMSGEPYTRAIEADLVVVAEAIDAAAGDRLETLRSCGKRAQGSLLGSTDVLRSASSHAERYSWKASNYREVSVLTAGDIVAEVLALELEDGSLAEGLRRRVGASQAYSEEAAADRAEILLRAPEAVRTAVQIGDRYGSSLADRRKATMLQALQGLDVLGREFSRRTSTSYADLLLLTPSEVDTFLRTPRVYEPRWHLRRDALVLVSSPFPLENTEMLAHLEIQRGTKAQRVPRKDDVSLAEGPAGRRMLDQLDLQMALFDHDGTPSIARGDVVTGPSESMVLEGVCRVITDPRDDELENGEILVATSTTPDFMPAIRRASALLVDQGGVLSHAALTSRELNKPCIVGVSIATALFRTGDIIRMDFTDGTACRVEASSGL